MEHVDLRMSVLTSPVIAAKDVSCVSPHNMISLSYQFIEDTPEEAS